MRRAPLPAAGLSASLPRSLLLLRLGDRLCALPREAVRRILPMPRLSVPPGLPAPVLGFLDLGGHPLPVVAIERLLGLDDLARDPEAAAACHLLVLAEEAVALRVGRALDLVTASAEALEPAPEAHSLNGCVAALWPRDGEHGEAGLVHVLDPARLLMAEERTRLAALRVAEAARQAAWAG